jgi:amino acid adenylation domain-containing protein
MAEIADRIAALSPKKRELLLRQLRASAAPEEKSIRPQDRARTRFPLSFAQRRLWFLEQLEPGSPAFNLHGGILLDGPLNILALASSLKELVRRHQALRTMFSMKDNEPIQTVLPRLNLAVPLVDLTGLPDQVRDHEVLRLAVQEAARPFDLAIGPHLRVTLVRLAHDRHALVPVMHHIVSDAWSMGLFFTEMGILYQMFCQKKPSPLPEPEFQYVDFAIWQREWLRGEVLQQQLSYWRQRLSDAPDALDLPTDHPRSLRPSWRGATTPAFLDRDITDRLKSLGQRHHATLFMTLLAVFKVLLLRCTGQEDILIGTPIANRNRHEFERTFGFFVNTLVLRTDLAGDPGFTEVLRRVRQGTLEAYDHQDLPFERLVEELQPERSLNRQPIFQVAFQLQNVTLVAPEFAGVKVLPLQTDSGAATFELSFTFTELEGCLSGLLQYSTELFDEYTAVRLALHFQTLAKVILGAPEKRVSSLVFLSAAECRQLLIEWNATTVEYPREKCIHELVEEQVRRNANHRSIASATGDLSYGELNERSNRLAHCLRELGVAPEVVVGIFMDRSPQMMVSILAVLKAGGAYLPLDPGYPLERLRFIIVDSGAQAVLTNGHLLARLPHTEIETVVLDDIDSPARNGNSENPASGVSPQNLAYLIYTSGSTGQPKGVAIQHQGLVNLASWHRQVYGLTAADQMTHLAGPSFDASVWEMWSCLAAGATLHLVEEAVRTDPAKLWAMYIKDGITQSFLPTPLAEALLAGRAYHPKGKLRTLLVGGDRLAAVPDGPLPFALVNHYGPTEATVVATCATVESADKLVPPIGRPIANTQAYILDRFGQLVPRGVIGELYIGSEGLARGYAGQPAATAEHFVPDGVGSHPGGRLYRTGDLARFLPDGNIEFLGRKDNQVKLRGFRIELGEIESALAAHSSVRQAVVLLSRNEKRAGEKRLIGYVVVNPDQRPTPDELHAFLKQKLPEYMVPSFIFIMEEFPLTRNGKVDRRALPEPQTAGHAAQEAESLPHSPLEEVVQGIWLEVLGLENVNVYANFFDLGGHSLLATQVISRLRTSLRVDLPVRTLFENPTIAGLVKEVESALRATSGIEAPLILPRPRGSNGDPLSFAQRRLWFLDQLTPDEGIYNLPAVLRLKGDLNLPILELCLNAIVERHESLRTTFIERNGEPFQIIHSIRPLRLTRIDLSALPAERRTETAVALGTGEIRRPFDLAHGPLLRVTVLRLDHQQHCVIVNMHHIVADGWSVGVFIQELAELYCAQVAGRPARLPKLRVQYADYAQWQHNWVEDVVLPTQLAYWKNRLLDAPVLELPTDFHRPAIQSFPGAQIWRELPPTLQRAVKRFSRQHDVTVFMTIQAAFGILLQRYSGQRKIILGSPIANRNRAEVEPLIGFFANTLIFIIDLQGNPSLSRLLARVREDSLEAYTHQDLPFERLVEAVHGHRNMGSNPLFQVMLAMQNAPMPKLELPGLSLEPVQLDTGYSKFDLLLSIVDSSDGLGVVLEYKTDLLHPTTAQRMLNQMQALLEDIVRDEERDIDCFMLMTAAERHQLLVEWNDTATPYSRTTCMQTLFEAEVERSPGAIAVELGDQRLTYAELNRRANRLAHCLREMGVQPEFTVGLCVERSLEVIVGLLAILKAGGVCVPLDTTYPADRLSFLIDDARVKLVIIRKRWLERMSDQSGQIRWLDIDKTLLENYPDHNPINFSSPSQLVHIVYTSGSTGRPKGAGIPHQAVVRLVRNSNFAALTPDQVFLQISPLSFDASTLEIWGCLLNGAKLVLMPPGPPAIDTLAKILEQYRITILWLSAGLFHSMVENHLSAFRGVQQLLSGGDILSPQHVRRVVQELPQCRLINGYGPTENTTFTSYYLISEPPAAGMSVPIGSPISNTRIYVLDSEMRPSPMGVPGELYTGGDGLARGYIHRPDLTAEKFVPDALSGQPGARLYRTGDRVRFLPNGCLEFLGRSDHQVKVRGYRIELEEIESTLRQHPAITECVVVVRPAGDLDKLIVAYLVTREHQEPPLEELRSFLNKGLPDYMVPHHFIYLDALPLTAQGKVDRSALPNPSTSRPELQVQFVVAKSELEKIISAIWQEVLEVEQVGIRDNFFDLGGHSLRMVRLNSKLRQTLPFPIPLLLLFEYPTIESLAAHLSQQKTSLHARNAAQEEQIENLKQGRNRLREQARRGRRGDKE